MDFDTRIVDWLTSKEHKVLPSNYESILGSKVYLSSCCRYNAIWVGRNISINVTYMNCEIKVKDY